MKAIEITEQGAAWAEQLETGSVIGAGRTVEVPLVTEVKPVRYAAHSSLHLAREALDHEFPHHDQKVKPGNVTDAILLKRLRARSAELKRLALEVAQLEIDLKKRINFSEGIEVPGEGILFWTKRNPRRRNKINWMQFVEDRKITDDELAPYRKEAPKRRFFLKRKARLPDGISQLNHPSNEEIELDEDL